MQLNSNPYDFEISNNKNDNRKQIDLDHFLNR